MGIDKKKKETKIELEIYLLIMTPKKKYICKVCGKEYYGFRLSNTCSIECGMKIERDSIEQLKNKKGPLYEKWKKGWAAGVAKKVRELRKG